MDETIANLVRLGLAGVGIYAVWLYVQTKQKKTARRAGLPQRGQTTVYGIPAGIPAYRQGPTPQTPAQVYASTPTNPYMTSFPSPSGYTPAFGPMENQPSGVV